MQFDNRPDDGEKPLLCYRHGDNCIIHTDPSAAQLGIEIVAGEVVTLDNCQISRVVGFSGLGNKVKLEPISEEEARMMNLLPHDDYPR